MSIFSLFKGTHDESKQAQLTEDVHAAWQRWQTAVEYFNSVSEPELIECAIHNIESTRKHYIYLLKRSRHNGKPELIPEALSGITTVRDLNENKLRTEERNWV